MRPEAVEAEASVRAGISRRAALAASLAWPIAAGAQVTTSTAFVPLMPPTEAPVARTPPPGFSSGQSLRFGLIPSGGIVESRESWAPLLTAMGLAMGLPIAMSPLPTYVSLEQAIKRDEVDVALLSGKLALDAVTQRRMVVVAEVVRPAAEPAQRALLLARTSGPTLTQVLAEPERYRIARGDRHSMSGFIVPQAELFLPHRIAMDVRFQSDLIETHQGTALAVANGDADVATGNTVDFDRFTQQFPEEAARLVVIWRSKPTPAAQFVVRRAHSAEFRRRLQSFLAGYGRRKGTGSDAEREVLKALRNSLGYVAADNSALIPAADLDYLHEKQRALGGQWVDEDALRARLRRIDQTHRDQVAELNRTER